MDGNKYSAQIIKNIKKLCLTREQDHLETKKLICVLVNGHSEESLNVLCKWGDDVCTKMKPQFIHSATAIYLLIKYPHMRPNDSFVNILVESDLEIECAKIALDVLKSDPDCELFLRRIDVAINGANGISFIGENDNTRLEVKNSL